MNIIIDKTKILNSKKPVISSVVENFNTLQSNNTPLNNIKFMNYFRHLPKEEILENLTCMIDANTTSSIDFFTKVVESSDFTTEELDKYKKHFTDNLNHDVSVDTGISNALDIIDKRSAECNSNKYLKENALFYLYESRVRCRCALESYIHNDLDIIMYNLNYSPETIADLELLIRKIKMSTTSEYYSSYPKLLAKSTEMIKLIDIELGKDVLSLVTSIPFVIAQKIENGKFTRNQIKSFIKIYEMQIAIIVKELHQNAAEKYVLYTTYMKSLNDGLEILSNKLKVVKESAIIDENIAEMQPDIIMYDESIVEDVSGEIEETIASIIFDESDDIDDNLFENLITLERTYNALMESNKPGGGAIIRGANKVGTEVRKIGNKAIAASKSAQRVKTAVDKSIEPFINLANKTVNDIKDADKKERTERIITGQYRFKLNSVIRKGILALTTVGVGGAIIKNGPKAVWATAKGTASIINPILLAIGLLVGVAIDKKIDKKHRQAILSDLEGELKIVNEKIEDSRGDDNKENKYKLMRIKMKLEKDIERIKYNLK